MSSSRDRGERRRKRTDGALAHEPAAEVEDLLLLVVDGQRRAGGASRDRALLGHGPQIEDSELVAVAVEDLAAVGDGDEVRLHVGVDWTERRGRSAAGTEGEQRVSDGARRTDAL